MHIHSRPFAIAAAAYLTAAITSAQTLQDAYNNGNGGIAVSTTTKPINYTGTENIFRVYGQPDKTAGYIVGRLMVGYAVSGSPSSALLNVRSLNYTGMPPSTSWGDFSVDDFFGHGLAIAVDQTTGTTRLWTKGSTASPAGSERLILGSEAQLSTANTMVLKDHRVGIGLAPGSDPAGTLHVRSALAGHNCDLNLESGSGAVWTIASTNAGNFAIWDPAAGITRFSITPAGGVTAQGSLSVTAASGANADLALMSGAGTSWTLASTTSGQLSIWNPSNSSVPLAVNRSNDHVKVMALEFPDATVQTTSAWSLSGNNLINTNAGAVAIGTTTPGSNKLAVEGTIGARAIVVTAATPFPDYVFSDGYALMPLEDLAREVRRHRRLPGLPSAEDVARDGINVGALQTALVAKVEELSLYAIQLERQNRAMEARLTVLERTLSGSREPTAPEDAR